MKFWPATWLMATHTKKNSALTGRTKEVDFTIYIWKAIYILACFLGRILFFAFRLMSLRNKNSMESNIWLNNSSGGRDTEYPCDVDDSVHCHTKPQKCYQETAAGRASAAEIQPRVSNHQWDPTQRSKEVSLRFSPDTSGWSQTCLEDSTMAQFHLPLSSKVWNKTYQAGTVTWEKSQQNQNHFSNLFDG